MLYASVGAGHRQAASAIVAALQSSAPRLDVSSADVMAFAPRFFRACYAGGFVLGMTRFPRVYGLGFRLTDRPHGPWRGRFERLRLWTERLATKRLARFLAEHQPDFIVNTHFLAPPVVARLVARGLLKASQAVVVTDIEVHRWWYSEGVDHWFAPADCGAATLLRWGIPPERITVCGIPVHPKWTAPVDRAKALADWKLPGDGKIVLLSGGTEFVCGPVPKIARDILSACPRACLVVLAGRNKDLLADLSRLPDAGKRLFPVAFTDRAQELAAVSSLMVTKPGGITTAECLARGVPMVLLRPVPGQEGGNAAYLAREGAAVIARNPREIVGAVARLLGDEGELARLAANARRLYKPATETIVKAVISAAG